MTGCKVSFIDWLTQSRIDRATEKALFIAQAQIEADCNRYCRFDTGTLAKSLYSEVKDKRQLDLSWNTPYARRVYFTGVARTEINPYAHILWADYASDLHRAEWAMILSKALRQEVR